METIITIRQAGVQDYAWAHDVIADTFAFHQQAVPAFFRATGTPPPTQQFITELLQGGGALFLAQDGEDVVGFLTIRVRQAPDEPYLQPVFEAIVDNLGVKTNRWRQGIGHKLMEAAHQWAKKHGASRVQLTVWEFNAGAIALYESLGYETFSRKMWKIL